MNKFTDQLGNIYNLERYPQRIISLVPSQTELLFDLGLRDEVVGITKFCVHPEEWFRSKARVGGTKTVDIEKVKALRPDLIIANKEENVKEQIEALQNFAPVFVSDVNNLSQALEMIMSVGHLTNRSERASEIIDNIASAFEQLPSTNHQRKTAYLIWKDPYMTVGGDTFINDMMKRCGFHNVFGDQIRYPEVTINSINAAGCDLLLLSSEPYPFKEKNIQELKELLPGTQVMLVDGEMFSWYGSRMQYSLKYFKDLLAEIVRV